MPSPSYTVVGSSDIVGALGNPNDVLPFWQRLVGSDTLPTVGFELIAWKYNWSRLSPQLCAQVAGLHGRTHTRFEPAALSLHLVNQVISPLSDLQAHAHLFTHPVYLLQHEPIVRHLLPQPIPPEVVVENDIYPGALNQAVFISQKIGPKNLVCDLAHLLLEVGLEKSLAQFSAAAEYCQLVHIPIGTVSGDSLPLDIPDTYLAEVGRLISAHSIQPVIECQWGGRGSVYCRPHLDPQKITHFHRWLNRLVSAGIINL